MKKYVSLFLITLIFTSGCSIQTKDYKVSDDLSEWWGYYTFFEDIDRSPNMADMMMVHDLLIYIKSGSCLATLSIDGWMTYERILTKVEGDINLINLIFIEHLTPESAYHSLLKEGDILLTLEKRNSDIYTTWNCHSPMITENKVPGIYFVKN